MKRLFPVLLILFLALADWMWVSAKANRAGFAGRVFATSVAAANPYYPTPAEEAHDREVSQWVQKAIQLLDENDFRGAQQAADTALQVEGPERQGVIAEELAPIYLRREQYEKAAALYGPHPDVGRNLSINEAIAFVKTNRLAEARKCYRDSQMLVYHRDFQPYLPGSGSAKDVEATVFLWRGIADVDWHRPKNAVWALHHALQIIPKNSLALWYYAEALADEGRVQEARHFYKAAISEDHGIVVKGAKMGLARLPGGT